ncbi:hypothetical protein KC359_g36 [Hortaea werneckii]|nr:hypothetical protein KC359_g36 [Hortaea werneckii]
MRAAFSIFKAVSVGFETFSVCKTLHTSLLRVLSHAILNGWCPSTPLEEWSVSLQLLPTKTNWSKSESFTPLFVSPSLRDTAAYPNIKKEKEKKIKNGLV